MTDSDITITRRTEDQAEVVTVSGEIDLYTCARLRDALRQAVDKTPGSVVVDMAAVEWLDSTGIGVLVGALKRAQGQGGTVQVAACPERITKHFRVKGLSNLFGMHATVTDALAVTAGASR